MPSRFEGLDPADYELPMEVRERTLSPALVVYLDRVRENVRRVLEYVGGVERWRPHVKTTKIPEVWGEFARAGLTRFKCATTREAGYLLETLRSEGVEQPDVLVAYPLLGPALGALGLLAEAHPEARLSVLCEDPGLVPAIPGRVSIFVDVDPGMHRTGIPADDVDAIRAVARSAGERFRGIHYYDGHLHDGDLLRRRRDIFACYDRLIELCEALEADGRRLDEVITSGTPAFLHALAYPPFEDTSSFTHRVSPGTVVYHDLRSEQENPDLELVPAAVVLTRIVSHPAGDVVTCDAGSKSIAAEAGDPCAFVLGHPELEPLTPSEEHLPLRLGSGTRPDRGEVLYLVPTHVCPTVNLAEEALLVDGGEVRVVPVKARAHDLEVTASTAET